MKGVNYMTIRELEILKAALECDIGYQLEAIHQRNKPEFKAWLEDSRKLLKKISKKLSDETAEAQGDKNAQYVVYSKSTGKIIYRNTIQQECLDYVDDMCISATPQ